MVSSSLSDVVSLGFAYIPASFLAAPSVPHCAWCTCVGAAARLKAVLGPFGRVRPRAAIDRAASVRHARRDLPTRVLRSGKSFCGALRRCGAFAWVSPIGRRCKASCSACLPICPGGGAERRIREGPRGPASPPNCRRRADVARNSVGMSRVRRAPGNSPAALERACGRWGSKRGGGGERSPWPPRRARTRRGGSGSRCAGGTGGRSITPKGGLFPAGWWDGALGMLET